MIIPFKKEHLEVMDIREHERILFSLYNFSASIESPVSYTFFHDGRIVLCGGMHLYANGIAGLWMVPSIYLPEYAKEVCKKMRPWLEEQKETLFLRRMETICIDDDLHNNWMTYIGFEREGTKRKYMDNKDYGIWGRIWD